MPRSGGPSSFAHRFTTSLLELADQVVDLGHHARDETSSSVRGRARRSELLEESAGRRRHHEHAVREEDRFPDVVRGEGTSCGRRARRARAARCPGAARGRARRAPRTARRPTGSVGRTRAPARGPRAAASRPRARAAAVGRPVGLHPGQPGLSSLLTLAERDVANAARDPCSPHREPREQRGLLEEHRAVGVRADRRPAVDEPLPPVGRSSPAITPSVEVFPEPLGPIRLTNSPRATSNVRPSNAGTCSPEGRVRVIPEVAHRDRRGGRSAGRVVPGSGGCSAHRVGTSPPSRSDDLAVLHDEDDRPVLDLAQDARDVREDTPLLVREFLPVDRLVVRWGCVVSSSVTARILERAGRTGCDGIVTSRPPGAR